MTIDGDFTGSLRTWPDYQPFLSSLVKWAERSRDDPSLFGTITRTGRTATVSREMDAEAALTCTGAAAHVIPPSESRPLSIPMRWVGPQRMEADLKLDSDGVYHGIVLTNEGRRVSLPSVVLPYSPEFEPKAPSAGLKAMLKLAEATGGGRVMHVRELLASAGSFGTEPVNAAPLLAGLVLLLLLTDIVTRKHLWGHLVPEFARRGSRRTLAGLRATASRVRRRRRREPEAPEQPPQVEETEPTPAQAAKPKKESVFARAKRRARMGRGDRRP